MHSSRKAGSEIVGVCFFDYNGNGKKEGHEPPIAGITVQIGDQLATTDSTGAYGLKGVPPGRQLLHIGGSPTFTYVSHSLKSFQSMDNAVEVEMDSEGARGLGKDLGLTQGFLTMPIAFGKEHILLSHNDLDHRIGHIRNWAGDSTPAVVFNNKDWRACVPNGTFDQHQGTDWAVPIGTPIVAMAPGVVVRVGDDPRFPKVVSIVHDTGVRKFTTEYGHNLENRTRVGEMVRRGEVIALSGDDAGEGGETSPHIHFNLYEVPAELTGVRKITQYLHSQPDPVVYPDGEWVKLVMDPYRDVSRVDDENFWTKDNDPQFAGVQVCDTGSSYDIQS